MKLNIPLKRDWRNKYTCWDKIIRRTDCTDLGNIVKYEYVEKEKQEWQVFTILAKVRGNGTTTAM